MKILLPLVSLLWSASLLADGQEVCTFGTLPLTTLNANQGGAKVTVQCSESKMNDELTAVGGEGNGKNKAEVVKYLLSKGFEIKSDNIMVKAPVIAPKVEEKKVIDLTTNPKSTQTL